ncbi:hypothetical protein CVT24_008618 [Panaeolus cyanescens]|uniref:Uncharacterized protein n=1 Tax=Panaeolus cyanescens TaxID=181874 RepID=A0A409VED9_9AGAR|nr:hypothetical protein CVT24_008618 [Panaeolus cyanescens]
MTAFATGGLLSDVFLHLVPHSFMGEHQGEGVQFVMVEEKRNILVGLGIFVGFATFFFMEKSLRVLGSDAEGEGVGHSHSHSHSHTPTTVTKATGSEQKSATQRKGKKNGNADNESNEKETSNGTNGTTAGPSKMSAYLNLFGDFVHNITFIGIAVHEASAGSNSHVEKVNLAAGIRQDANGLLGTTLVLADLVIPFVAGGFLYIGAVAVLPT